MASPYDFTGYSSFNGSGTDPSGNQRTTFTDPNPVTGYLANKAGFDPSHPIQSTSGLLGLTQPTPAAVGSLMTAGDTSQGTVAPYLQQQQDALARMLATRQQQNTLASNLYGTIMGRGPSVANATLMNGLAQIRQQQMAGAAGANGQNAYAARMAALRNTANAGIGASGQAAVARANEVANAQNALSNLYAGENQADVNQGNTAAQTGLGFAKNATDAYTGAGQIQAGVNKNNADMNKDVVEKGGQGLAMLFG